MSANKILTGLKEAIAHAKGEPVPVRLTTIERKGERAVVRTEGKPPRIVRLVPGGREARP